MSRAGSPHCPDCRAAVGERHLHGCDVARCASTGRQRLTCTGGHPGTCEPTVWTGDWPGAAEARELGWWAKQVPGKGWVPTTADDPDPTVMEDLNRVAAQTVWDAAQQKYVLP